MQIQFQNPFKLHTFNEQHRKVSEALAVVERYHCENAAVSRVIKVDTSVLEHQLRKLRFQIEAQISCEESNAKVIRAYGYRSDGESWRHWIVLTKEFSQRIDTVEALEVWCSFGFDPSESEQSSYSPTGRSFRHRAVIYKSSGHYVVRQSGGIDV